ncbi:hypothetical protein ABZ840_12950 [Streptomyces sp. NPDC047117]|uniref:hypothetical protein n=1 Tax=Streptomyces sp. NPDC047117 TaxID=3155379 RepID=UPI0033C91CEB
MNTATTNRFRGRAGRRLAAAVAVAAALGLGVTACGQGDDAAAGTTGSSASAQHDGGSANKGSSGSAADIGSKTAPEGGGLANAGNHKIVEGKLEYMAPGKLIVKRQDGGMDQAFFVANATKILGAASICSDDPDGGVTIGDDGYGTSECTVEQLEKAAKTEAVTVRVTMSTKSGAAETVEEKYHP